jgi:hypothetical protein
MVEVPGACEGVKAPDCGGCWGLWYVIRVVGGGELTLGGEVDGIPVSDGGRKGWEFEAVAILAVVLSWTDFFQRL